ncbi:MAG: hypothetical protein GY839_06405 [candidate division Zixibacteria bacterium]|nr:hypothetical protein [candidate division Zixibacteria bacterium]
MAMEKCPKCGSTDIDNGRMIGIDSIFYKSSKHLFILKENCLSYACLTCGYIESYISEEYLNKIKQK